jgi:predicted HTH transcriptional regulator
MAVRGKRIQEIIPKDIYDLVKQHAVEDEFLDFKKVLFHPDLPKDQTENEKNDFALDCVAFANAQGGHMIIGVEEDVEHRASALSPMDGYQAQQIAKICRDIAIARIKPSIPQLQAQPVELSGRQWLAVVHVPESINKPHMWVFNDHMRFVIRDNDRKRIMAYDEIREMLLSGPREEQMRRLSTDIESLRSLFEELVSRLPERGQT